jgi:alkyl hydroperoxide reductase subunit AhpF
MAILSEGVREQLRARFAERLIGPVHLTLYTRPGSGRLVLPSGVGCATCEEARELAEELRDAAPDKVSLEIVDVTITPDANVKEVPTLRVSAPGGDPRIAWQGLPGGFEFATVVDAMERLSAGEPGLSEQTLAWLERLEADLEVMVFATPT